MGIEKAAFRIYPVLSFRNDVRQKAILFQGFVIFFMDFPIKMIAKLKHKVLNNKTRTKHRNSTNNESLLYIVYILSLIFNQMSHESKTCVKQPLKNRQNKDINDKR